MNIDEALKSRKTPDIDSRNVIYFVGSIQEDTEEYFRLYPNPGQKQKYMRIKKDDISGKLYELEIEEINDLGYLPPYGLTPNNMFSLFQVPLKKNAEVEYISIKIAKVGVEYPLELSQLINRHSRKFNDVSRHKCNCGCGGNKDSKDPGYCDSSSACNSTCQWCNGVDNTCKCSDCACH